MFENTVKVAACESFFAKKSPDESLSMKVYRWKSTDESLSENQLFRANLSVETLPVEDFNLKSLLLDQDCLRLSIFHTVSS